MPLSDVQALPVVAAALDHLLRSGVAVAVVTRAARVVLANDAFTATTGLGPGDVLGLSARERLIVSVAPLADGSIEPEHSIVLVREVRERFAAFECELA